ncbi:MAG: DUF6198 family protein [Clostridiales bacterium]|nr:DUF6198 family protein [Clostridiales bacterium]
MKRQYFYRGLFYLVGLVLLALGISLNTKTQLGVSPIISVSYSISTILGLNFGNTTLVQYTIFIVIEIILHLIKGKKKQALLDVLQFPLSLVFTRFLNVFGAGIPDFVADLSGTWMGTLGGRILFLLLAIILTGVGAAMSLEVRLIPNPGDGIVQTLADTLGWSVGLTKNCFDLLNITITFCVGMVSGNFLLGIGLGTVFAVLGVGRAIAVFDHFCLKGMQRMIGVESC